MTVILTSITLPNTPCASTRSPALKGLKASDIRPPAKFCTVPDSAIPIARPPAASSAAREVVSTPSVLMEITTSKTVIEIEVNEITNEAIVGSVLRLSNTRLRMLFTHRMRKIPITKISKAASTLRPNCVALSTKICQKSDGFSLANAIICFAPSRTESRFCWICSAVGAAT